MRSRLVKRHFEARRPILAVSGTRASVSLASVSREEYAAIVDMQIREFADQKVRAGHWQPEAAEELSRHVIESFLPRDGPKEGHRVWKAVDAQGGSVGWLWVGPPPVKPMNAPTRRWLYQITVEPALRGRGYGRAMLEAVERLLAREGVEELYLNVFRWNVAGRALYDSAGYVVVHDAEQDTGMKKSLRI